MSLASEFDFGDRFNSVNSSLRIDDVVHQIQGLRFREKDGQKQSNNLRLKKSFDSALSFDFDSPTSPGASTTSIHSSSFDIPTSSYWHVPDKSSYLTSIAFQENSRLCAIGSGAVTDNLFLYEVYPDEVTHHQTITLPEISALQWVSPRTKLGQMGNVLVSGHKTGMVHLTMMPDTDSQDGSAEILKRYNHIKHLPTFKEGGSRSRSARIQALELTSSSWDCCAPSSIFSLCGDHIFLWEPNRSDVPLVKQKTTNTNTLGLCGSRDGVYALGRKRGVCIRDIRVRDRVNSGLKPPTDNDESVNLVKWNPFDGGNKLAAVHDRTTIKIWDIRSKAPLAVYRRHADAINSIEWSTENELVSASADGTIRVWDVENSISDGPASPNAHGSTSSESSSPTTGNPTWTNYVKRQSMQADLDSYASDLLSGELPVTQSHHFNAMSLVPMGPSLGAVTIDSGNLLGVHELYDIPYTDRSHSAISLAASSMSSAGDYLPPI